MQYRTLGKTGWRISEISLGTWQVGGRWGSPFNEKTAAHTLRAALDGGINFIDTADVYSEGLSERAVGNVLKECREEVYVATKCGRQIQPHVTEGYTPAALTKYVEDSLKRLQRDTIDLVQLHCPPTPVYDRPEIFETFERLQEQGKIRHLGVSVEKIAEAQKAIEYPNVATVQIIFNMFRLRPADDFFPQAKDKNVGVIVRVPLASGLLAGKMTNNTVFDPDDHRNFNRNGEAFDKGETFSGVPYGQGLEAVEALKKIFPEGELAAWALRWVLMFPEVSTVIPGASHAEQVVSNVHAAELPAISQEQLQAVRNVYDRYIRASVHTLW
ncbi:Predicted oxidoreductase [Catalinimonas alkaloidigena]|uniref:Predicted oxidoreductase n=1 Tax=Catalinimonas alkaloidigena TaxID=1075417 RepID=A0A1G9BEP6_9BACT|nr:aldo/keto reductase [Catalinimonas alkaloidigena]SDK37951.1 Predicted oxidoreductase [Catalinimonas alkaloidigena]